MQKIYPCLWFDGQAEAAAKLYTSLFKDSKIRTIAHFGKAGAEVSGQPQGSVMTVAFEIDGQRVLGLNGGPLFKMNPSFSLFVWCKDEAEIDHLWRELTKDGEIRMDLEKQPYADKYGWTTDRFGVEWQLMWSRDEKHFGIAPSFLFTEELFGRGQEAIDFYIAQFRNSEVQFMARNEKTDTVMHCVFTLAGQRFVLMEGEGKHDAKFSEGFSLVVNCDSQAEIDRYWTDFTANGGSPSECGWLKDKFGVSWQITPSLLDQWSQEGPAAERMQEKLYRMQKIDIATLQRAYGN